MPTKVKKILLIAPPYLRTNKEAQGRLPLGLCYLASVLEKHGHDVNIYLGDFAPEHLGLRSLDKVKSRHSAYAQALQDMEHPVWKEVEQVVAQQRPDIVGVTVMTVAYGSALNVSRIVKRLHPETTVVWGGPHPTVLSEECAQNPEVDIVIRGEGEQTLLDLVTKPDRLEQIPGLSYRTRHGIVHNPDRTLLSHLDELPFPAKHLVLGIDNAPREVFRRVMASRGCPYSCIYCDRHSIWGPRVRHRSVENFVAELMYLEKTYGVRSFGFEDDNFTQDHKFVHDFCDALTRRKLDYKWTCTARPDQLDEDIVQRMKRAGCEEFYIGIECGNEASLQQVGRGITLEQVRSAARILHQAKVRFVAAFMIGFPWETKREIRDTLALMKELNPTKVTLSVATPHPGTALFRMCKEQGIIGENVDWSTFFHTNIKAFYSKQLSAEEARRITTEALETAENHNRKSGRRLLLGRPLYAAKRAVKGRYYQPLRMRRAIAHYLWPR